MPARSLGGGARSGARRDGFWRMLASVALRTSMGPWRRSVPSSSSRSKAERNAAGWFGVCGAHGRQPHPARRSTPPRHRAGRTLTLRWFRASSAASGKRVVQSLPRRVLRRMPRGSRRAMKPITVVLDFVQPAGTERLISIAVVSPVGGPYGLRIYVCLSGASAGATC